MFNLERIRQLFTTAANNIRGSGSRIRSVKDIQRLADEFAGKIRLEGLEADGPEVRRFVDALCHAPPEQANEAIAASRTLHSAGSKFALHMRNTSLSIKAGNQYAGNPNGQTTMLYMGALIEYALYDVRTNVGISFIARDLESVTTRRNETLNFSNAHYDLIHAFEQGTVAEDVPCVPDIREVLRETPEIEKVIRGDIMMYRAMMALQQNDRTRALELYTKAGETWRKFPDRVEFFHPSQG